MNTAQLMAIVRDEGLDIPVIDGDGHLHDDAVVVERVASGWTVYLVDERHAVIESTVRSFSTESDALDRALLKLRQVARARSRGGENPVHEEYGDLSHAIVTYLRNYPGRNDEEFQAGFAAGVRDSVQAILDETSHIRVEWGEKSLVEIGDEVERILHERHPELSSAALEKLAAYFTYLVR